MYELKNTWLKAFIIYTSLLKQVSPIQFQRFFWVSKQALYCIEDTHSTPVIYKNKKILKEQKTGLMSKQKFILISGNDAFYLTCIMNKLKIKWSILLKHYKITQWGICLLTFYLLPNKCAHFGRMNMWMCICKYTINTYFMFVCI